MKDCINRYIWVAAALVLLSCMIACSTGNQGTAPLPERTVSDSFSVTQLDGQGTYTPDLIVTEDTAGVTAVVSAVDATALVSAAFHLNYDDSRYTPRSVEISDFMGGDGEVLTLSLTNRAGYVPVAVAQIAASFVAPRSGDGLLARVNFDRTPFTGPRGVSGSPAGDANTVADLKIINQGAGTVDLHWTEVNIGDYDNNGFVLASDLSPLGFYYGQTVELTNDPERAGLVDGNGNGMIELGDITPIGVNYEHKLSGYVLFEDAGGTLAYGSGITILRTAAQSHPENTNPNHPVKYNFTADVPQGFVQFTVRPVADDDLGNPGPVSNFAEIISDDVPPEPPTNVVATSNATTGHKKVQVTWTASPSLDVRDYVVERQEDSFPGLWEVVNTVGSSITSLIDDSAILQEVPYTYRIHAIDYTDRVSPYATSAPVTPYIFVLPAPTNLEADNSIPTGNAIQLTWDAPADDTGIAFYRVYDADTDTPLHTTMNKMIREFLHTGLTASVTYNYYVVSVSALQVESAPTATVGCVPSEVSEINITSLTTDKTTHRNDGSEPASNLAVTTDIPSTSVDWSCTVGSVTGTGENVTWACPPGSNPVKVTITCTVYNGSAEDSRDIYLYLTTAEIMTQYGDNGSYKTGAPTTEMLDRLANGGNTIVNRQFEYYMVPENVVILVTYDTS